MKKDGVKILRWSTRIISILVAIFFLIFLVGEFNVEEVSKITMGEMFLLVFVPFGMVLGMVIAWMKEILGGAIVIVSILLFNIISMIIESNFTFELDFGMFMIVGLLFIICGLSEKNVKN